MTHTSTRGERRIAPGDYTGRIMEQQRTEKDDRWRAVKETVNHLNAGEPVMIVPVAGGQVFAVPRDAYDRILQLGAQQ